MDDDNNGLQSVTGGLVISPLIQLVEGSEPTDGTTETGRGNFLDNGSDADADMTIDFGFLPAQSIAGNVWLDVNGNGVLNPEDTNRLSGVIVVLFTTNGVPLATNVTTASGAYLFTNVPPGDYVVVEFDSAGYVSTGDTGGTNDNRIPVTMAAGGVSLWNDFLDAQAVTIGDFVWVDTNRDGVQGGGEPGLGGVEVVLYRTNSGAGTLTAVATNLSFASGAYSFTNQLPGSYVIGFGLPGGFAYTTPNAGADTNLDSNALTNNGQTAVFTLLSGQTNNSIDAGFVQLVALGNLVFHDVNGDGIFNAGDSGAPSVSVELYTNGQTAGVSIPVATTDTDANGNYYFDGLIPGTYFVHIAAHEFQAGGHLIGAHNSLSTLTGDFEDHGIYDNQPEVNGISTPLVTLAIGTMPTGENTTGYPGSVPDTNHNFLIDLGFVPATNQVLIGDLVFQDTNNNGHRDPGEPGINGVVVELWAVGVGPGGTDVLVETQTTSTLGGNPGSYLFVKPPGTFYVKIPAVNFAPGGALVGLPQSSSSVSAGNNNNHGAQSGGNGTAAVAAPVTLADQQNDFKQDFGFTAPVTIGDFVWVDTNGNGVQDGGEPGLAGVEIVLYGTNSGLGTLTALATNTSSAGGAYSFTNVPPGDFVVSFGLPSGYRYTTPNAGGDTNLDSNALTNNGQTVVFTLTSGQTNNSIDAGYFLPAQIVGSVRLDLNGNGVADGDDTNGIPTVTISVYDANSNLDFMYL